MVTLVGTLGKTVRGTVTAFGATTRVLTPAIHSLAKGAVKVYRAEEKGYQEALPKTKSHIDSEYNKTKEVVNTSWEELKDYSSMSFDQMLALREQAKEAKASKAAKTEDVQLELATA